MGNAWKKINKVTFLFLSFFLLLLFSTMFLSIQDYWKLAIIFVGSVILLVGLSEEKKKLKHERYTLAREIDVIIIIPSAALLTFLISTRLDLGYGYLGPVIAAGLVGFLGSFLMPHKFGNPIYCGAFIGMTSAAIFPSFWFIILAGLVGSFVFILSHEVYNQTGGTLGTIAFSSVNIVKKVILGFIGGFLG